MRRSVVCAIFNCANRRLDKGVRFSSNEPVQYCHQSAWVLVYLISFKVISADADLDLNFAHNLL